MAENSMELGDEVSVFRSKFKEKYAGELSTGEYEEADVHRLMTEDSFTSRFILHCKKDVDKAMVMTDTSLKWRKSIGLSELTESSFPASIHELSALFYHKTDIGGHKLLHFQVGKCKKDPSQNATVKAFIGWWIDKTNRQTPDQPIVLLMDMTNTRLANMDLDLIRFIVTCFTTYFPFYLEYMLIYEMPWVLNAIWKIIKNLLTEEQQKRVLFVKKNDMKLYIQPENLFVHMGGLDPFEYHYTDSGTSHDGEAGEEVADVSTELKSSTSLTNINGVNAAPIPGVSRHHSMDDVMLPNHAQDNYFSLQPTATSADNSMAQGSSLLRKRVTFAETAGDATPDSLPQGQAKDLASVLKDRPMHKGTLCDISPMEYFEFSVSDYSQEAADVLTIINTSSSSLAYKVKTTSPDRYRVKPSTGLISPGGVASISVCLLSQGVTLNSVKDKFLIMLMSVNTDVKSVSEVSDRWRSRSPQHNYTEHRLYCKVSAVPSTPQAALGGEVTGETPYTGRQTPDALTNLTIKLDEMLIRQASLERSVKLLVRTSLLCVLLVVISLIYQVYYR